MGGVFTHRFGILSGAGGGGGPPFLAGNNTDSGFNMSLAAWQWRGYTFQAAASGTINNLVIVGSSGGAMSATYLLTVYAATSASNISGALLGRTANQTSLGLSEVKTIPLLAPVSIVMGNWYAFGANCDLGGSGLACRINTAGNGRFFGDDFPDGPLGTAPASGDNGPASPFIYGTS